MAGMIAVILSFQHTIGPYAFLVGQDWLSESVQWSVLLTVYLPTWLACDYCPAIADAVERITDVYFSLNR